MGIHSILAVSLNTHHSHSTNPAFRIILATQRSNHRRTTRISMGPLHLDRTGHPMDTVIQCIPTRRNRQAGRTAHHKRLRNLRFLLAALWARSSSAARATP
jgi:hypothetical protein